MSVLRIAACLLLAASGINLSGQDNTPASPQTVSEVFDKSVSAAERGTLALANAMPEGRYWFAPTKGEFKGVRTFAQLAKHIAVANYQMGAALQREKVPIEPGPHNNGPDSLRSKADVVKFLRESFVYLHKAIATVNEHNLMEVVELPEGGRVPRLSVVTAAISHPWDIYGQMIEYLRMNGIDPQKE
ncbi:MAG TPA: DinB family protein [Candidatus Binatia bacterium]|nr:DinB family protein [Candidatus Binatia bacterium]